MINYYSGFAKIVGVSDVRTKLCFKCKVSLFNYFFIFLTETLLHNSFFDNELCLTSYVVFRCDRNTYTNSFSRGDGALNAKLCGL